LKVKADSPARPPKKDRNGRILHDLPIIPDKRSPLLHAISD
jgi:hypothetical protein